MCKLAGDAAKNSVISYLLPCWSAVKEQLEACLGPPAALCSSNKRDPEQR